MNGREHTIGGAIAGPLVGAALAASKNRQPSITEVCGWLAGGIAGAKIPDLLEPAFCPHHRKFCHSGCVFVVNVVALQSQTLQDLIDGLLKSASEYHVLAANDPTNAASYKLCAYFLEFAAGALPGLVGGYVSHLVLDSMTPHGLPLFS